MKPYEATLALNLRALRLSAFEANWHEVSDQACKKGWHYGEFLSALCQLEIQKRKESRLKRLLKEANLPSHKTLGSLDFSFNTSIQASQINALAESDSWIRKGENLIIFGPSGVGKTHIASAIAYRHIEQGLPVRLFQTTHLVQLLQQAKVQFRLKESLQRLDKIPLIILDDFGYAKKDEQETSVLFELISHRYERGSLLITANQPFSKWDKIFPDEVMTVASIDRLVHHARIISITGESYRIKGKKGSLSS